VLINALKIYQINLNLILYSTLKHAYKSAIFAIYLQFNIQSMNNGQELLSF